MPTSSFASFSRRKPCVSRFSILCRWPTITPGFWCGTFPLAAQVAKRGSRSPTQQCSSGIRRMQPCTFKEWTMSSVRPSNSGCTQIVGRARSYLSALPTIQVHPELDGRTLDIVHCFYNIARHQFFTLKSRLIKLQVLHAHVHVHVHVLFSLTARFATRVRARARVVFTGSTFALLIFRRFRCFCNHFRHILKSSRNPNSNVE